MKFSYLLILASFLVSCDPSVDHDQIVQNDSDFDIWFRVKSLYQYDSLLLPKREETIIFGDHGLGSPRHYENCDYFFSDTTDLLVKDSIHMQVLVDIDSVALWTYTLLDDYGYGSGKCECRFIITNNDIK